MGAKKAANLFRIYCFVCRCGAARYSVFMLSVKPELEQAFNQLCSDVVLHIRVVIAVYFGKIADISGIAVKDSLYRYTGRTKGRNKLSPDIKKTNEIITTVRTAATWKASQPCNSGFSLSFFPLADRRSHFL